MPPHLPPCRLRSGMPGPLLRPLLRLLIAPLLFIPAAPALTAPRTPATDTEVLERLPFKAQDPVAQELRQMRAELRRDPRNLPVALKLAQRYYSMVGEEGDPRWLGYAQAALAPWWDMAPPPIEVQVLRASLRQFRHDFSGALDDLGQVLAREPRHVQALALRATIHIVQARYAEARADCRALAALGSATAPLVAVGCEAMADGLNGKLKPAYDTLSALAAAQPDVAPDTRLWVSTRLAEMAQRSGDPTGAERHFKAALALKIPNTFLLAAYADFLLAQRRPAEVLTLLATHSRSDVLLLRLALADAALGGKQAQAFTVPLAARYDAARMRGDTAHQQEEARFALEIGRDPGRALALAKENWKVQREPRDAQVLLQAALALGDTEAAKPVLEWLAQSQIEETGLQDLARRLNNGQGKGVAK